MLGLVASYSLKLTWGPVCWDINAIYSFAKLCVPTGTRANHAAVASFSSCQHRHSIIAVKKFSDLSLASLGSAELLHLTYGQAGDPVTGIGLLISTYYAEGPIAGTGC